MFDTMNSRRYSCFTCEKLQRTVVLKCILESFISFYILLKYDVGVYIAKSILHYYYMQSQNICVFQTPIVAIKNFDMF